jgi:hemolysin type calcium-binding protein
MIRGSVVPALALVVLACSAAPAAAAFPDDGKRWRQVRDTSGVTWNQVAAVCPTDGVTRCSGVAGGRDLTGWIWATDAQVVALMGHYEPSILTADPPSVSGPELLIQAISFLEDMKPTFFFSGYPTTVSTVSGWTASDVPGSVGGAGYQHPIFNGSFGVGASAPPDEPSSWRGTWLWRPATDDLTPPVIRPVVSGTAGLNGWYTSDVSVSWDVSDPESAATSSCATTVVTTDTAGTTLTCTATSGGGTATGSFVVRRDTVRPVLTCASPPQAFDLYQLGVFVSATVTDATSGPERPTVQGATSTQVAGTFSSVLTGADRAGHRTSVSCTYRVVVPTCRGLTPTIVGTALNNIINGTSGPDVIVALGGADTVRGGGGDDTICGGDGPDLIEGGDGRDWIDGGASNDDLNGGNGDDFLDGGLHIDSIRGDSGRDTCVSGEQRMSSCEA